VPASPPCERAGCCSARAAVRLDRPPPSLNRLIGLKWLAGTFYPGEAPLDLHTETREIYGLFYQVELDNAQLDRLLGPAGDAAP
jgi:iron complex transport system substrate-binding protein